MLGSEKGRGEVGCNYYSNNISRFIFRLKLTDGYSFESGYREGITRDLVKSGGKGEDCKKKTDLTLRKIFSSNYPRKVNIRYGSINYK